MARKKKRKPLLKFPKRMQKKMIVMFGMIALMLIGLIVRLMYIEHTSGEKYEKIVLSQQKDDSKTIPYQRGDIVDSKGTVLATSIAVYNVILDCYVLTSKDDYIEPTIKAVTECFPDITADQLRGYVKDEADNRYIVLKKKVPYNEVQPFVELQEAENEKGKKINPYIKGIWFEKEYQREYPHGELASAVVGFTASGNLGVNGLENYYNRDLNGVDGRSYGYLNDDKNFEKNIRPAKNGNTIVTTIDANIQAIVEKKIRDFNEAYSGNYRENEGGATHIGVLIMDPNNGDVLAMANYPNYDLSNPRDLSKYYSEDEIGAMDEDAKMEALNKLWQNFAVTYTYEPGSTAKPFTVAAGLETGKISTTDTYYCDGYEMFAGRKVKCVNTSGHGAETLEQAIMNSCNDALMHISYNLGADTFTEYQQIFGFGQKTNIDFPGEARTDSLIYTREKMKEIDLATNAFGQNFNTTMIQLGNSFCSIINGGNLYQPRLVKRITDENGNTVTDLSPTLLRKTVSKSTSDTLRQYMQSTVTEGTGTAAKVDGYTMGGKTGTAQKVPRDGINYLVSFIGFAPVENPQLMIYCVVDEPNDAVQYHSTFAQNIAREILEEVLPYMNIYRDEETTGVHEGWDIKGDPAGEQSISDIVNNEDGTNPPVEGDLGDMPDTTGNVPGYKEGAEGDGSGDGTPEGDTGGGVNTGDGTAPEEDSGNTDGSGANTGDGTAPGEDSGNTDGNSTGGNDGGQGE